MQKRDFKLGILFLISIIVLVGFIITQEVSKNKIGEKFKLKPDDVIVSEPDSIKVEQNKLIITKAQSVIIKGYRQDFLGNTNVIFDADGTIRIELPNEAEVKEPNIVDETKKADVKFLYSSKDGKLKLPTGDLFDGALTYEIKGGKGQFYTEDKKTINIGKLSIDNSLGKRIDFYFDGEKHESQNQYISLGKEKLNLGNGAKINFESGNRFLERMNDKHQVSIETKEKGIVTITKRGETIPLIETYGDFRIENGGEVLSTIIDTNNKRNIGVDPLADKKGKSAYPIEIANYEINGEMLFSKVKSKIVLGKDGNWQVVPFNDASNKFLDYGLSETGSVIPPTSPSTTPDVEPPRFVITPPESGSSTTLPPENANTNQGNAQTLYNYQNIADLRQGNNFEASRYQNKRQEISAVRQLLGVAGYFESGDDLGHETIHGINSKLTEIYGGQDRVYGFYAMNGRFDILNEPSGITMAQVRRFVPSDAIQSDEDTYKLYMVSQANRYFNNQPLYVLDEYTAYIGGAEVSANINGRQSTSVNQFTAYSLALGRAIENGNQNYWQGTDGTKFRNFLADTISRGVQAQASQSRTSVEEVQNNINGILNDDLRNFAKRNFGVQWTKQNLGF